MKIQYLGNSGFYLEWSENVKIKDFWHTHFKIYMYKLKNYIG